MERPSGGSVTGGYRWNTGLVLVGQCILGEEGRGRRALAILPSLFFKDEDLRGSLLLTVGWGELGAGRGAGVSDWIVTESVWRRVPGAGLQHL